MKAYKGGSWSFPRGKINKDEPDTDCAIREVWEETGYDISPLILPDAFLEIQIKEQRVKLYIIPGVPTETPMAPQTRKEISSIGWIRLVDLPGYSKRTKGSRPGIKLYMVTPFLSGLRRWIAQNGYRKGQLGQFERFNSAGMTDDGVGMEEEDMLKEDVVQNGTTGELIAMLRRQQTPQPQVQQHQQGTVDLLRMLRNGSAKVPLPNNQIPASYVPANETTASMPSSVAPTFTQGQGTLPFQGSSRVTPGGQPDMARRNSLLSLLKGGPSLVPVRPDVPISTKPVQPPLQPNTDIAKSGHQQSLLSAFKSPSQSITTPSQTPKTATTHQKSLLMSLKNPNTGTSSPQPFQPAQPPPVPQDPTPKPVPPPSSHQNALLSTLKGSPSVPKTATPPSPKPIPKQITILKRPSPAPVTVPSQLHPQPPTLPSSKTRPTGEPSDYHSMISASTAPLSPPKLALDEKQAASAPKSPLLLELASRRVPSPSQQASLLSVLKTAPPQQLGHSPVNPEHQSSLLGVLKGPPGHQRTASIPSTVDGNMESEKSDGGFRSKHVESLMKNWISPRASPVLEKATPALEKEENKSSVPATVVGSTSKGLVNDEDDVSKKEHSQSIIRILRRSAPATSTEKQQNGDSLSTQKKSEPRTSEAVKSQVEISKAGSGIPTPTSTNSLLATLKGSKPTPPQSSAATSTTQTSHQKSLLSLFNPSSKSTATASTSTSSIPSKRTPPASPSSSQQFNFSPNPQINKRTKFRDVLTPSGVKDTSEPTAPPKQNGTIDLSKMQLLKRPQPPPPTQAQNSEKVPERALEKEDGKLEKATLSAAGTPVAKRKEDAEEKSPDSPMGVEFAFRKRTPSKSVSASPTPSGTPTVTSTASKAAGVQSLLALFKAPKEERVTEENREEFPKETGEVNEMNVDVAPEDNVSSLLRALKGTSGKEQSVAEAVKDKGKDVEQDDHDSVETERERKLLASLERALSRGMRF